MIYQIQKKEHDALKRRRKSTGKSLGFLIFKGEDGNYYKTDTTGMVAVKEMTTFNKRFKAAVDNQTAFL